MKALVLFFKKRQEWVQDEKVEQKDSSMKRHVEFTRSLLMERSRSQQARTSVSKIVQVMVKQKGEWSKTWNLPIYQFGMGITRIAKKLSDFLEKEMTIKKQSKISKIYQWTIIKDLMKGQLQLNRIPPSTFGMKMESKIRCSNLVMDQKSMGKDLIKNRLTGMDGKCI